MRRFNFWQKWLLVMGLITIFFGFVLLYVAVSAQVPSYINDVFWESGNLPTGVKEFQGWIFGASASVWLAFGLVIVFMAIFPFKKKEKWVWNCLISCILVWFLIDTSFSILHGIYTNALNNFIFFVLLILPLIFTKKEFH